MLIVEERAFVTGMIATCRSTRSSPSSRIHRNVRLTWIMVYAFGRLTAWGPASRCLSAVDAKPKRCTSV
jgi:hypothetical protein